MIKYLPLDFLGASYRMPWKNEKAVYHTQISGLPVVLGIYKFEKCAKYAANEMTDDVTHSKEYCSLSSI